MSKHYLPCLALLLCIFSTTVSAQTDFIEHNIALGGQNFPGNGETADFDGDGLLDILIYNSGGHNSYTAAGQTTHIAWYKNLGNGEYKKHPIRAIHVDNAIVADFDQDGDMDILCSYYFRGSNDLRDNGAGVRVYLNDGNGNFTEKRISSAVSAEIEKGIELKDINNDGYPDFLFGYRVEVYTTVRVGQNEYEAEPTGEIRYSTTIYINKGDGTFIASNLGIVTVFRGGGFIKTDCGDLNGDGNLDFSVLRWDSQRDRPTIYAQIFQPTDSTFSSTLISDQAYNTSTPFLFDIDNDGDLDIRDYRVRPDGERTVFLNDGLGNFTPEVIDESIVINIPSKNNYREIDFDHDGDLDQLRTDYSWHENTGTDYVEHVIDSFLIKNNANIIDPDADGDWDILVVIRDRDSDDYKRVFLWVNDGNDNFTQQLLEDNKYWLRNFAATDVDGDNDLDFVVTSWVNSELLWFENNGEQNFTEHFIASGLDGIIGIISFDIDQDGDDDIVTTASRDDEVSWWQNDGSGNFTEVPIIDNLDWPYDLSHGDFDNDGDGDFVLTASDEDEVSLWLNDGTGSFAKSVLAKGEIPNPIEVADLNGDDRLDIVVGYVGDDKIDIFLNDGNANFTEITILSDINASYLHLNDIDMDNRIDIIVSNLRYDGELVWLKNDGSASFTKSVIGDEGYYGQVTSSDYDDDGDIDIFYSRHFAPTGNDLKFLKNDGSGNFTETIFDRTFFYTRDLQSLDLDQDGDLDLVGTSVAIGFKWWENQLISDPNATAITVTNCPSNITTITADPFVQINWDEPTATTTCPDQGITIDQVLGQSSGSDFTIGSYVIDYEITDACDNKKDCTFRILIEEEPEPAVLTLEFCPQDITELTNGNTTPVNWNLPVATTTCDIPDVTITQVKGLPIGSDFQIGTHIITYEINDQCDNFSTCSFNIHVEKRSVVECPKTLPNMTFLGELNGHHYFLSDGTDNWLGAQATARNLGGYLVSINNQAETNFIQNSVNEIVFIGINDAEEERTVVWDSGESIGVFSFTGINNEENDFGIFHFWNGTWGFDNKWVHKRFIVEIDCDIYQPCSMNAEISLVQCDDNGTLSTLQDDYFGFQLMVNGYGNTTYWKTNIGGQEVTGDYNVPTDFNNIPLFAPGQTVTIMLEDADGGCSTNISLNIPRPCPGTSLCPTELVGYEFLGRHNGHHYFISTNPSSWLEANDYIKGIQSYLVTINDEAENRFLQSRVSEIAFIGLNDYLEDGRPIWQTGEEPIYSNYGNCSICSTNSEINDFASFNFWDGTWGFDNQWVVRNHILEVECGFGTRVSPRTTKKYTPFTNHFNLFPNPVYETAIIDLEIETDRTEVFQIFNVQNQLVFEQKAELKKGMNRVKFDISNIANGLYFLKAINEERMLKFMIQNRL